MAGQMEESESCNTSSCGGKLQESTVYDAAVTLVFMHIPTHSFQALTPD